MNLGDLITALEAADPTRTVRRGFNNPHSYRGCYDELAFEPAHNITVRDMLDAARSALYATFQGYKGGDYVMHGHTDVWLSDYGMASGDTLSVLLLEYMLADTVQTAAGTLESLRPCDRPGWHPAHDWDDGQAHCLGIPDGASSDDRPANAPSAPADTDLTAEEARTLADDLGLKLYRAQDALEFVEECCTIADREQRTVTTADVRGWLKGAHCSHHQSSAPADTDLRDRIADAIHRYDNHHALSGNDVPSQHHYGEADAVLAVLPAPADRTAEVEQLRSERDDIVNDALGGLDRITEAEHRAVHRTAAVLRRMADEAQQTDPECSASISGSCLSESESDGPCDTDAGECVHGGRPADEEQQVDPAGDDEIVAS